MKEVFDYIKSLNIVENSNVVVAVSGGPDSMCLLNILLKYSKKNNINIICAHVNHSKRRQSEEEKEYVYKYCSNNNIRFEYLKIEKYNNENFHEQARNIRYNFFDKIVKKYNSKYLFMAHHGDDLIETILMRISRGASSRGYSGIRINSKRNNYYIIRPLLFVTKNDILNYLDKYNIRYYVDESNNSDIYTRNRYRKYILPFLKSENKNIHKKYLEFSDEIYKEEEYISNIVNTKYMEIAVNDIININKIIKEDKYIQEKLIYLYLMDIYQDNIKLINREHIKLLVEIINNNRPNIFINLPNNMIAIKEYNKLYIKKNSNKRDNYKLLLNNEVNISNYNIKFVDNTVDSSNYTIKLNSKEIKLPLYIRNRCDGDVMEVKGLNGSKKIKDIMIDAKVPLSNRDNIPLLVDSSGKILCLFGIKKSKYDKQNNEFYDIIVKCTKKEEE